MSSQSTQIKESDGFWLRDVDITDGIIRIPDPYREAHDIGPKDVIEVFIQVDAAVGVQIVYQRYRKMWDDGMRFTIPSAELDDLREEWSEYRLESADVYIVKRHDSGEDNE